MTNPEVIPQSMYADATSAILSTIDVPLDLESFYAVWMLHQAADTAREHQLRHALDNYSLSWTQFEVVWNMWIFGEREAGFVATAAMLSKSGLTTVLSQLDRRGLIHRRADPQDGRKSLVRLSPLGERTARAAWAEIHASEQSFSANLTSSEKRQLVDLLGVLLAANTRGRSAR